jgi:hypothetical protein
MKKRTLRVRASGDVRVVNIEALNAGARRFVGRQWSDEAEDFVACGDVDVPFRGEYLEALKEGSLLPADAATAKLAGLDFDGVE